MFRAYEPDVTIDGADFSTLDEFYQVLGDAAFPERPWGMNLDALNDMLRGRSFTLRWKHSALSRERLGYGETVRQLELRLPRVHESNRDRVAAELAEARHGTGPTVFDWLMDVLKDAPGVPIVLE